MLCYNRAMGKKVGNFVIETLKTILFSLICVMIITNFIAMPCMVDGSSMYPTLVDRQRGFSGIITKHFEGVERFDIVVIDLEEKYLVKRVIGLPGEYLEFIDDELYIDHELVAQSFLDTDYIDSYKKEKGIENFTKNFSIQLGDDEYFCMGDNRYISQDSRFYGPFSLEQIHAKGLLVYYPFNSIGVKK